MLMQFVCCGRTCCLHNLRVCTSASFHFFAILNSQKVFFSLIQYTFTFMGIVTFYEKFRLRMYLDFI